MKQHTGLIVGTDAIELLSSEIESLIKDVTKSADHLAKLNDRRTIKNRDIIVALNKVYDDKWLEEQEMVR